MDDVGKGKKDTGYLYKAFMVARRPWTERDLHDFYTFKYPLIWLYTWRQ